MNTIFPDFHLPTKIYIAPDILEDAGEIVVPFGSRALLIATSADFEHMEGQIEELQQKISATGTACIVYDEISEIPNTEFIDSAVYFAKRTNCNLIIGFGGIESINAAKAVALLTNNFLFCDDLFHNPNEVIFATRALKTSRRSAEEKAERSWTFSRLSAIV